MKTIRGRRIGESGRRRGVARRGTGHKSERPDPKAKILARLAGTEPDGLVLCMYGSHADVAFSDKSVRFCLLAPKVHKHFKISVGDLVWTKRGATDEERIIIARAERRTELRRKRGDEDRTGHVIAANMDQMAIVVALREPPLRTGAIDRYLILASVLGVKPLLLLTKADQAPADDPGWDVLEPYRELGVPILATSAKSGHGLDELRVALADQVTVFAGHSGVGKSSLCLALELEGAPEAGEMSTARGRVRGRHKTSIARLLELPKGGWVVDTPGVRSIGLMDITPKDIGVHFPEFSAVASRCEFSDCMHLDEDGCAMDDAIEDGLVAEPRFLSYLRLIETMAEEQSAIRGT